jgi:lipid-binding SYLF domain-containing protein
MNPGTTFNRWTKVLCALLLISASTAVLAADPAETREKVRKQSAEALARLYEAKPEARAVVEGAKGYATFSKWGLTLGAVGGGIGRGLAVSAKTGDETFMRFVEGSAGLGLGVKKFDLVFVFETEAALTQFIDKGWTGNAQATVALKGEHEGRAFDGAASVSPGVWVYQITDKGLAAEISLKGTKYYRDKTLE